MHSAAMNMLPTPPAGIGLVRMPQQSEARTYEDDWTGLSDAAARRKLQNRLNQRLYRKRRANPNRNAPKLGEAHTSTLMAMAMALRSADSHVALSRKFRGLLLAVNATADLDPSTRGGTCPSSLPVPVGVGDASRATDPARGPMARLDPSELQKIADRYEEMARRDFMLGSPRAGQLLTLIQFNIFRALLRNTQALGWGFEWLECAEPLSPWNASHKDAPPPICPPSLRPTDAQREIEHHPWIDLWPIPKLRDNLLRAAGLYDEDRLCNDLVEFSDVTNEQSGLIVWGDPWDPAAWEVSEAFVRDWAWTIKGCVELLASTNYWRTRRGEEPLTFET